MSAEEPKSAASPWSFRIATISGIPIRIHFTFFLLLAWVAVVSRQRQDSQWPILILAIFFCVLLHELGHSLTGQRLGVPTRDITLYPIGGVAMLQKRPNARQELLITIAGPAVNVVIAAAIGAYLYATTGTLPSVEMSGGGFLVNLFAANVVLALFNLIPAFPMDGGRILRAALALRMDERRATSIAGAIGQGLAIVLVFYSVFTSNILLGIVAFFVFLGAGQEINVTATRSLLVGRKVSDAMLTQFRTISHGDSLGSAAEILLQGSQQDFPVVAGEDTVGVLVRNAIIQGLSQQGPGAYVAEYMNRQPRQMAPDDSLDGVMERFGDDATPILVRDGEHLVGMVTRENLSEFLMLEDARNRLRRNPTVA